MYDSIIQSGQALHTAYDAGALSGRTCRIGFDGLVSVWSRRPASIGPAGAKMDEGGPKSAGFAATNQVRRAEAVEFVHLGHQPATYFGGGHDFCLFQRTAASRSVGADVRRIRAPKKEGHEANELDNKARRSESRHLDSYRCKCFGYRNLQNSSLAGSDLSAFEK